MKVKDIDVRINKPEKDVKGIFIYTTFVLEELLVKTLSPGSLRDGMFYCPVKEVNLESPFVKFVLQNN